MFFVMLSSFRGDLSCGSVGIAAVIAAHSLCHKAPHGIIAVVGGQKLVWSPTAVGRQDSFIQFLSDFRFIFRLNMLLESFCGRIGVGVSAYSFYTIDSVHHVI